ncbi:MAG TPA: dTDP-4-dehydrorhamnose reductase [Candidatus Angelobacter sp.]|jgi:dTDP-4-dehydrorhamnose reductase|nr:dTDP-4-dehydrorhamnose reductase [Candidatus Angelobacter sp.]
MRVAVIGGNGQLGEDVAAAFAAEGDEVKSLTHQDLEVSSEESVARSLDAIRPKIVINTAAFHHVEKCETEPAAAFAANAVGARNVARASHSLGATLFHISTDYVFDGLKQSPYTEEDPAKPLNVYANSKLAGEYFVRAENPRHFVVRVSGLYGLHPCRAKGNLNFVELMLKLSRERDELRVVNDEFVTPTPTVEVARQLVGLSRTSDYGLYHATSEGSCSWYEFAKAIFELSGTRVKLEPARPGEFPIKVARPKYSVLENAALKRNGRNVFEHWRKGLERYLLHDRQPAARHA